MTSGKARAQRVVDEITVVVPFHDEESDIRYTLTQLENQSFKPAKVVLVDSSSKDSSNMLIRQWIVEAPASRSHFELIVSNASTPGEARNIGAASATTPLIAFMDCGLSFPTDWLHHSITLLAALDEICWVSGVCQTSGEGIVDECAIGNTYGRHARRPALPSSVLRTSDFRRVGDFRNLRAGEDGEWVNRANRSGLLRVTFSDCVVQYLSVNYANSMTTLLTKAITYAYPMIRAGRWFAVLTSLLMPVVAIVWATFSTLTIWWLAVAYLLLRSLVALRKNRSAVRYFLRPDRLVVLWATALVIDVGRSIGAFQSIIGLLASSPKRQIPTRDAA